VNSTASAAAYTCASGLVGDDTFEPGSCSSMSVRCTPVYCSISSTEVDSGELASSNRSVICDAQTQSSSAGLSFPNSVFKVYLRYKQAIISVELLKRCTR
jgi:hypothetical protein